MNAPTTPTGARRPVSREMSKILADTRDLAIHRLLLTFTTLLDKVGDMLMDRAGRTDVREEQTMLLDARLALKAERPSLLAAFEKSLRSHVNESIAGKEAAKADFSKVAADNLTLVDTSVMDESVILGNITRVIENSCYDELQTLNRAIGHLLGRPDLETTQNPLAPATIVASFAEALKTVKSEERMKSAVLKELNQTSLSDISVIYADLNKHLAGLRVVPAGGGRSAIINRGSPADRARSAQSQPAAGPGVSPPMPQMPMPQMPMMGQEAAPVSEMDVMSLFRRMFAGQAVPARPAFPPMAGPEVPPGGFGMPMAG